ncbi:MAG: (Fe-S)-binding protein [Candidatus Thorarchaeota archaeon]
MSSVWTKSRKNTPEIDCGLCGYTTCGAFARAVIVENAEVSSCPVLALEKHASQRDDLIALVREAKNTEKPAPEQPEGGVLLSKPCMDSPDLLMAEMRIFNGVNPGDMMKYGVLDPAILCWLLDCVSSRYEDMRCSKELAYAWGNMEEIRVHILRDGRVRMRRARDAEHALESFKIIERTVMGGVICNCCGRDLLTILAGFAEPAEEHHAVFDGGSTLSINMDLIDWTPSEGKHITKPISQMVEHIDELYQDLMDQINRFISGEAIHEQTSESRSKICRIISLMVDPEEQGSETIFLRGLALAFFIDDALIGLNSLNQLLTDGSVEDSVLVKYLTDAKAMSLQSLNVESLPAADILPLAHSMRIERAIQLYDQWKK